MDCSRLKLSIPSLRVSDDGATHTYGIAVVYGKLRWDVFHRFSEYHAVYDKLLEYSLEAVPQPPPKSIGRPNNSAVLEERRLMLETWLKALCRRPDIRSSSPFVDFIEFELHTSCSVPPLLPHLQAVVQDPKFQLSDFQWVPSSRSVFASYEDSASMARLGKVWSLVESDEMGSLSVWSFPHASDYNWSRETNETSSTEPYFDKLIHTSTYQRCRALFFHEATGRIFVGLESGVVEVYRFPSRTQHNRKNTEDATVTETFCGLEKEEQLNLHSESIMSIRGNNAGPGRILTVGFDKAVRVVNCTTLETLSGGKLTKRLSSGHHLTTGVLENASNEEEFLKSRMFIGSSNGSVFIFSSMVNPPEWLHTIEGEGSNPITALELAGSSLLVAQKYTLSIYRVGKAVEDCKVVRIAKYEPELKFGRTIRSVAVSRTTPLLFLGHTEAITVWDCRQGVCVSTFKAHYNGIRRLCVLEDEDLITPRYNAESECNGRQLQLISGASDGTLKLWKISHVDELKLWKSETQDEQSPTCSASTASGGAHSEILNSDHNTAEQHTSQFDKLSKNEEGQVRRRAGAEMRHPPKRTWESSTDEDDSLFPSDGFTQVTPHRH